MSTSRLDVNSVNRLLRFLGLLSADDASVEFRASYGIMDHGAVVINLVGGGCGLPFSRCGDEEFSMILPIDISAPAWTRPPVDHGLVHKVIELEASVETIIAEAGAGGDVVLMGGEAGQ